MKKCTATLKGIAPMSFSKAVASPRNQGEEFTAYEERTWREKAHVTDEGLLFVPPMAMKNIIANAAQYLSEQVPGKGKATYTKHFLSGTMVMDPLMFDPAIKLADVKPERLFLPSDCKRGGGSRVWKMFPTIPEGWILRTIIYVMDPTLETDDCRIVHRYLSHGGQFIGFLRFRRRNGGYYGGYVVENFAVEDVASSEAA